MTSFTILQKEKIIKTTNAWKVDIKKSTITKMAMASSSHHAACAFALLQRPNKHAT